MKALLIEDDNSIRNVLRMGLTAKSFAIDEADNGEMGSYLARINQYDVIIIDNVLPKKMGREICTDIRNAQIETPIIMLSGKSEVLTKIDLLNSGADDYLTKPFSFEELVARINAVTRRPHKMVDAILKIADVKLNTATQEVSKKNKRVTLTRKEFALLELFMKHENKVISRAHIMEHVWNNQTDPFSNTIESHIMNLRKKIGDTKKRLIKNIAGRGYKISSPQQ